MRPSWRGSRGGYHPDAWLQPSTRAPGWLGTRNREAYRRGLFEAARWATQLLARHGCALWLSLRHRDSTPRARLTHVGPALAALQSGPITIVSLTSSRSVKGRSLALTHLRCPLTDLVPLLTEGKHETFFHRAWLVPLFVSRPATGTQLVLGVRGWPTRVPGTNVVKGGKQRIRRPAIVVVVGRRGLFAYP